MFNVKKYNLSFIINLIKGFIINDNIVVDFWFSNCWTMQGKTKQFKVKRRLTNNEVIKIAKTKSGWSCSAVYRNNIKIYNRHKPNY